MHFYDMYLLRSPFNNSVILKYQRRHFYVQITFYTTNKTTISSRIISHRALWLEASFAYEGNDVLPDYLRFYLPGE